MRKIKLTVLAIIIGHLVLGCTGTIFKKFSIDETPPNSVSLDARQRLIIVTDKGGPIRDSTSILKSGIRRQSFLRLFGRESNFINRI